MKSFSFFVFFVFFQGCQTRGCTVPSVKVEISAVEADGTAEVKAGAIETSAAAAAEEALRYAQEALTEARDEAARAYWRERWHYAYRSLANARAEAVSAAKAPPPPVPATTVEARDAPGSWPFFDWHQKSIFWCLILVFSWLAGVLILRDANENWAAAFPLVAGLAGAAFLATTPDGGGYPVRLLFAGASAALAALALYRPGPELLWLRILGGVAALFFFYSLI